MKTLEWKNFKEEIDAFSQETFRCKKCKKISPFGETAELEFMQCASCETPHLRPKKIGKFWLFQLLNQGKNGDSYISHHEDFHHRLFSVKILPPDLDDQAKCIKKLEAEADYVRSLASHPQLLSAIESGNENGTHYLAIEHVVGERLDSRLNRLGVLPEIEAIMLTLQLLSVEAHICNCGYLFRNLKPENIIVSDHSGAYLSGFDLCVPLKTTEQDLLSPENDFSYHMPPERILGKSENISTEIYSLGMILYQCLTGKTYFSEDELRRMEVKLKGELLTLNKVHSKMEGISSDIAEILNKMIKRIPEQRYQYFHQVEHEMVQVLGHRF